MEETKLVLSIMPKIRRVLVINTGGTSGMLKNEKGILVPQKIEEMFRRLPQLHDEEYWRTHLAHSERKEYLVLPDGKKDLKILYKFLEYEELKDSSDFTLDDWIKQARDIKIPIFQARSDGINNFICSMLIASTMVIPEVTVFFGAKLFRGSRVKKVSNTSINAFDTPNYPPILAARTTLDLDPKALIHPPGSVPDECRLHDRLCRKVYTLKVNPTITAEVIRSVFQGMEGVVLETYGNGNIPIKRKEIYQEIERAVKCNVLVVNVTQCINGTVQATYEHGLLLVECGVVPAFDMTAEAAWAKLCYVLSMTELSYQQKVKLMKTNIRGELYNPNHVIVNEKCITTLNSEMR